MRQTMPASELGWAQLGLTRVRLAGLALLALVYLVALPVWFAGSNYILGVLTNASILSFISLGVWVTFAIGRINISQGAFALIGGYTAAILSTRYGVSFWLCLPLAGLVAAAIGTIIGTAILRLRDTGVRHDDVVRLGFGHDVARDRIDFAVAQHLVAVGRRQHAIAVQAEGAGARV